MPQLPPVAAAAFVFALLAVILITTVVVQVRSRRRRMRLAMMVRETAPIPRPAMPSAESVGLTPSLRGQDYLRAQGDARFEPFADRPTTREGAPGRPGRRLAAQVAHAAAASVAAAPVDGVSAVPAHTALASTHGGLGEVILDFDHPLSAVPSAPDASVVIEAAEAQSLPPGPVLASASEDHSFGWPAAEREPRQEPHREPLREPRVTVLAPRQPMPALPAFMTREVSLGEAARALRGSLTMTDGRQLRRAVAVGAATSVVAAAFAIRGRRR
ncbi:MAG: hypothetical protein EPO65_13205, partial [Dehalococcoidia bacterium]